ncbi:hypothetical protein [Natronorubrum sulfidifaciens]|uniref:C2H2-type domain-containing protein n=1 Tax=Natronorubrum sulfidifaciens JCM 14089 TaxID=1230460 RepID=L9VWC9_9EURY|nr:hypothetical protein [Natronorubrum sulfidifaciens]ELY41485.1 hypothetical protein C495_16735 [Natronorubrum sulfidifaciens JCM 14089]
MTIVNNHEAVLKRAEQLEREGAREMRLRAEARAVAGYEPGDIEATDGSEIIIADDDIQAHTFEIEDRILLVDADDDPHIATDGGCDQFTETTVEFAFEYTSITGRRRRVMIVPDTCGEAWRIEHERRAGEWREAGREPITEFDLHVRGQLEEHNAREIDPDSQSQSAVSDGGNVREWFLTTQDHYCDICSRPFDSIDDLANHDCRRHPESD